MRIFKNRYGELRSGWGIVAVIILIIIGQLTASALVSDTGDTNVILTVLITLLYGGITILGGVFLFKLLYGQSPQQLGLIFEKWIPDILQGLAIGGLSMVLVFTALLLSGQANVIEVYWSKLASVTIVVELVSVSVFAFSEELLARGFMMTALKTTRNKYAVFFVPAVLFSSLHFLNPGVTVLSFLNTLLAGLLFAYLFIKSGKLWLPSGFHIAWNFFQGDILGMNVSGGEGYSVINTQMTGSNTFLAGAEYGPEGGIIVTIVLILVFVYTHFLVKPSSDLSWTTESDLPITRRAYQ